MSDNCTSTKQPHLMELMNQMCKEAGIQECQPQLLLQMCDMAYSLTKNVLVEARSVADFSGKKFVEKSDVDFALKTFNEKYCKDRPPIALMNDLAQEKNSQPLPQIRQNYGLRLPNDRFCQLQSNFVYDDLPSTSNNNEDEDDELRQRNIQTSENPPKRQKPESSTNFNPDLVANLLMGRTNNDSRKRAFHDEEKEDKTEDFDDYDFLLVRPSAILTQFYNGYNSNQPTFNGYYLPYYYTNGLDLLSPLLTQLLSSLSLPNLTNLFNALSASSPFSPGFLNNLRLTNPPIYNAYNQLYNAYGAMDPAMQQAVQQFCVALLNSLQNGVRMYNSQPNPLFDQSYPQLASFLRSPGMQQFASNPLPNFATMQQTPQLQSVNPVVNPLNPPLQQAPILQPTGGLANAAGTGINGNAGGGLLDGILGAVGSVANSALNNK
uniref:Uncharacterized protein n=1 Tax=Meloidogyne javanica TaxID=6303 RepID=A0A915MB07_MELJA